MQLPFWSSWCHLVVLMACIVYEYQDYNMECRCNGDWLAHMRYGGLKLLKSSLANNIGVALLFCF